MRTRSTSNPPNPFARSQLEYEPGEGPPASSVVLLEDHSRSILSHNDSPDLGFRWSVNPYRGCVHACAYCMSGDTPILMGDGQTRRLADVRVGDEVYGTQFDGKYRRYVRTRILDRWDVVEPAYRVSLSDGTELVASGDHRFLSNRGWKFVTGAEHGRARRPHLTENNWLLGTGQFASPPAHDVSYRSGYLSGLIRGDGLFRVYDYSGRRRGRDVVRQFRLALADLEALARARSYLRSFDIETREFQFQAARAGYREMRAIGAGSRVCFERVARVIAWPGGEDDESWHKGFLAGVFDAEGSHSQHVLRISNADETFLIQVVASARRLGFDVVVDAASAGHVAHNVRIRGGMGEHLRFFHTVDPAISRKRSIEGYALKHRDRLRVLAIEPIGRRPLVDITTGTGDFIADGIVSHNCYARPTHEYLDFGAGTDFDTKIVYKPRAAELLRGAFDAPSWKGECVMFSGVTDCYQPLESTLQLTRACLEVCLEYRNPVAIISKSALVERDVALLAELAREAQATVSVSLAFADAEMARAIEPWAPSPERRLRVIETMASAGIPVGIMMAPIIPGLNDEQLPELMARARAAGARTAGWTLLRLPGSVATVFEERLRAAAPLAADKVLSRIRDTRGGARLSDSRFHLRQSGQGQYADAIAAMFSVTAARLGFRSRHDDEEETPSTFRRPAKRQLSLF